MILKDKRKTLCKTQKIIKDKMNQMSLQCVFKFVLIFPSFL